MHWDCTLGSISYYVKIENGHIALFSLSAKKVQNCQKDVDS